MPVAAIDWGKLLELVWASALAGIAVAIVFAALILGGTRASDYRRAQEGATAAAYMALAVVALVVFAVAVVVGVTVMLRKG